MPEASTPPSVQRYELAERIAKGGMGEVYRARAYGAHGFSKDVAIKRILPHLVHPEFEQRFIGEAKLTARLTHANIVQVLDFGREGNALFIAMEYVDGVDLATVLSERLMAGAPIPLSAAVHIGIGICTGLDFAHDCGVLHRDVSPANILLSVAGEVKIADFGLAKATAGGGPTRANRVMGKWRYLSPEQSRAETLDARSDLYAAAVVIHELFTGRPLFAARNPEATLEKIQSGAVPPASRDRPDLPPEFDAVLARALALDRERRYANGEEMARALTEACYATGLVHTAKDVARLVRERRHPAAAPAREKTAATDMELSSPVAASSGSTGGPPALDEPAVPEPPPADAGARMTRTFTRAGIDDSGLPRWDASTTYHTTADVSLLSAEPRPARPWWPAVVAAIVIAAVVGAAIAASQRSGSETAAATGADASTPAPGLDASGEIEAPIAPESIDAATVAADATPAPPPATIDAASSDTDAAPVPAKLLAVTSRPSGASVSLDGRRVGTTPLKLDVSDRAGRARLRIARPGHEPAELSVDLDNPKKVHRRLEPLFDTINVGVTDSWAKVYVGGKHVGDTPLRGLRLPHGRHKLRLVNPETGKKKTVTVTVPAKRAYVFSL